MRPADIDVRQSRLNMEDVTPQNNLQAMTFGFKFNLGLGDVMLPSILQVMTLRYETVSSTRVFESELGIQVSRS